MNLKEIRKKQQLITKLVIENNIKDAIDQIISLTENSKKRDLRIELDNYDFTYQNILKYSFELTDDPERDVIYKKLQKELIELTDLTTENIIEENLLISYYSLKRDVNFPRNLSVSDWEKKVGEIEKIMLDNEFHNQNDEVIHNNLQLIFNLIWLSNDFNEAELKLIESICNSSKIKWYYKSIIVSSLTLSLFRYFDVDKINLLIMFLERNDNFVWQRALIGLILGLLIYDDRLFLYPEITERLKSFNGELKLEKNMELIIIQFIRAQDTERITKKIQEEIMPEMMKMRSKLTDKLNLDDITSLEELHEKNPEWETVFEDSPDLYDKVEKISKMQIEGVDVFHSAFSMLKHFPFFNEITNWFLPFYKENKMLEKFSTGMDESDFNSFIEGLEKSAFMCNSDKYSFCLNVHMLPDEHKKQLIKLFDLELSAMNEVAEDDELLNLTVKNKSIFNQYIHDMYRFFKVHPKRQEFNDIFNLSIDFNDSFLLQNIFDDDKILRNIGEFYFENELYVQAIDIFSYLSKNHNQYELYEKIGFAYQRINQFKKAIEYYKKAELLDSERSWIFKKLGYCFKATNQFDLALEYFLKAEKMEENNLYIEANIGNIYMDLKNYDEALKRYYKVEYLSPNKISIMRPLSWCSLQVGNIENAKKYLVKIEESKRNENDYLNLGHIEWILGDKQKAIGYYGLSVNKAKEGYKWFRQEILNDYSLLEKHNITLFEVNLMIDYLAYNNV